MTASGFHLIGKETERGWEHAEDESTLFPALVRYGTNNGVLTRDEQEALRKIPLKVLDRTGLSRHTIVRVRRGEWVRPRSLNTLRTFLHAHSGTAGR